MPSNTPEGLTPTEALTRIAALVPTWNTYPAFALFIDEVRAIIAQVPEASRG